MKARYVDPLLLDVKNAQGEIASLKKENADLLQTIKRMDASMASKTDTALEKLQEKLTLAITKKTDEVVTQCNTNITKVKDETSTALTNMRNANEQRHQASNEGHQKILLETREAIEKLVEDKFLLLSKSMNEYQSSSKEKLELTKKAMEEKVTDLDKLIESNAKSMSEKIMQDTQNKIDILQSAMESNEKKARDMRRRADEDDGRLENVFGVRACESEERAFGHVIRPPK